MSVLDQFNLSGKTALVTGCKRGIGKAIAPGYIATDNTAALQADPVRNPAILARIPAGRWGNPDELQRPRGVLGFRCVQVHARNDHDRRWRLDGKMKGDGRRKAVDGRL